MDGEELLNALRTQGEAVLHELYLRHRTPCTHFLLGRIISHKEVNREELAVELYTESLIILVENVRSGKLTELYASPETYLNAVARNLYLKSLRRKREEYREPANLPAPLVDATEHVDPGEVRKELYRNMNKLGGRCRQLLVHFYFLGLDWDSTADVLGYKNADSAKNNKAKCMKRLRSLYGVTKPSK